MKTTIAKSFSVDHPLELVWDYLSDPHKIVACVPGAKLTETIDDRNYKGTVTMKIGPVSTSFNGKINLSQLDEATHAMEIQGKGTDTRGKGSANMVLSAKLDGDSEQTEVSSEMDISITGKLAQFGARMITDVSDQVFKQFVSNFRQQLDQANPPSAPQSEQDKVTAEGYQPAPETTKQASESPKQTSESQAKPINAISLFFSLIWNRILRLFGRKT